MSAPSSGVKPLPRRVIGASGRAAKQGAPCELVIGHVLYAGDDSRLRERIVELHFRTGVLEKHGVEMIGAKADAIERGEDRERFKELMLEIDLDVPVSGIAHNMDDAWAIADRIGKFPLIIRPAYTLGGTGGGNGANGGFVQTPQQPNAGMRRDWHRHQAAHQNSGSSGDTPLDYHSGSSGGSRNGDRNGGWSQHGQYEHMNRRAARLACGRGGSWEMALALSDGSLEACRFFRRFLIDVSNASKIVFLFCSLTPLQRSRAKKEKKEKK